MTNDDKKDDKLTAKMTEVWGLLKPVTGRVLDPNYTYSEDWRVNSCTSEDWGEQ